MMKFCINVHNADFSATNDTEANSVEEARQLGLKGALEIGSEEVSKGKPFFGAEVTISGDGYMERFVVSVGASHLK